MFGNKILATNPYASMSAEDIQAIMGVTSNPATIAQCKEALALKDQPEAYVTVELLRNTRAKAVGNSFRIQGKLVRAFTKNYEGELTFGFGDVKDTAKIGIFLMVPDYVYSELSFAQGQHATFKVAFSEHPTTGTPFVLQAGTIPTLKKNPETGETNTVWIKGKKEVIASECPGEGWTQAMSPVYSEIRVEDFVDAVTVNMASVNSVVPADPMVWIKESTEYQQAVDKHNLAQWNSSRATNILTPTEGDKAASEALASQEAEVVI